MIDGHFKFYKHVNDNPEFAKTFLDLLFEFSAIIIPLHFL